MGTEDSNKEVRRTDDHSTENRRPTDRLTRDGRTEESLADDSGTEGLRAEARRAGGRRTDPDRQSAFADFASTIQAVRGGDHAREMAVAVFQYATGRTALVGLVDDCERAVFYEGDAHALTAVPLDEHGLDHGAGERLWNRLSDPTTWVDARGDDLDWIHPRYRWVLAGDASVWRSPRRP